MSRVASVGSEGLVLGLQWQYFAQGAQAKQEIHRLPRGSRYFKLSAPKADEVWVAPLDAQTSASARHLVPGACYIGAALADAVVVWPFEGDSVWVAAITQGRPVPGFDRVVSAAQVDAATAEILSLFPQHTRVGQLPGARLTVQAALDRVEGAADESRDVRQAIGAARPLKRGAEASSLRTLALGGAALACVAGYLYIEYPFTEVQVVPTAVAEETAAERARANASAQQALTRFWAQVDEESNKVKQQAGRATLSKEWRQIQEARSKLPVSLGGYRPTTISCTQGKCSVSWANASRAPSLEAKSLVTGRPPDDRDLSYSATTEFSYEPVKPEPVSDYLVMDPGLLRIRLIDATRRFPSLAGLNVGELQPLTLGAPAQLGAKAPILGYAGDISASVGGPKSVERALQLFSFLEQYPVHLKNINISLGPVGDITGLSLTARYVVAQELEGGQRAISIR